jgi:hypothetical protein
MQNKGPRGKPKTELKPKEWSQEDPNQSGI